ncbi:MAG: hypothetical protein Q4C79_01120 [Neisseria sp.]|uniref:hypothetical protein n=1 Tax=Neisseria sp. TaxID=192066 RepID=UPI0026DC0776|nr:hypothetical protein [Neisseria sp.]MDO4247560.1 hypothetical protein [Neisseria sp.]
MKTNTTNTPKTINATAGYTCLCSLLDNLFKLAEPQIRQLSKQETEVLTELMKGAENHLADIQHGMGIVMNSIPQENVESQGADFYHGLTQTLLLGESRTMLNEWANDLDYTANQRD